MAERFILVEKITPFMEDYSGKAILVSGEIGQYGQRLFSKGINMVIGPCGSGKTMLLRHMLSGKRIRQVKADCDEGLSMAERYMLDVENALLEAGSDSSLILDDFGSCLTMENIIGLVEKARSKGVKVIATGWNEEMLRFADKAVFLEGGQIKLVKELKR